MSNVGYAVFGSPKGIAVTSNGLFKELNLDKTLYLNSSHVSLDKKQQILMLRRIPSDLNNLERKDALLVVLYEQALQYGENRPGGFVGSAICFKERVPNAEKMMSGLFYLFSKIKENVDKDNRFKAIDNSTWNISLPDATKEFGMFSEERIMYLPLSESRKNIAVKLSNLEKESPLLLSNFTINHSLHEVDYLYASDSMNVIQNLPQKDFIRLDTATLFNYKRHFDFYQQKTNQANGKLKDLKYESEKIENKIKFDTNTVNSLASKLISKQSEVEKIDREIVGANQELESTKQQVQEEKRNLDEVKRLGKRYQPSNPSPITSKDAKKLVELKEILANARQVIEKHTSFKFNSNDNHDKQEETEFFIKHYFEELPERKEKASRRNKFIFWLLLTLTIVFLGLFLLKNHQYNTLNTEIDLREKKEDSLKLAKAEELKSKRNLLLSNIKKFNKNGSKPNYEEFRKYSNTLLDSLVAGAYEEDSEEIKFIEDYKWEFWEFDYTNKVLIKKLRLNDDTYFINLETYKIKELKANFKWNAQRNFERYFNDYNDIYEFLAPKIRNDKVLLKKHYLWILNKLNDPDSLKVGKKVKLPFLNIEKSKP